jgi:hypothetical protein
LTAYVGDGVGGAGFDPGGFSGFEFDLRWGLAFHVGAQVQVGNGDEDVRSVVMVFGDDAAGIQLEVGGADVVLDEEDVLSAAVEDVEAAFFVPFTGGVEFVALQEFDGDDLERKVREIFGGVGEGAGDEDGFAVLKSAQEWGFADDVVFDLGGSQDDEDVVVTVMMHDHGGVRREIDFESAGVRVLEEEMVVGLGGDLDDRGSGLRRGEDREEQRRDEKAERFHRADFSIIHGGRRTV